MAADPPWPTRGWPTATPEGQGLDRAALARMRAELAGGAHGLMDSMLVVRDGHVAWEESFPRDYAALFPPNAGPRGMYNYYDPEWHPHYRKTRLHTMQSVTKSVTSALIGIAIRRGELAGPNAPVLPHFRRFKVSPDPRRTRQTLRDLLTMTAGIQWDESTVPYTDPRNSCAAMEASRDWVQFVLDQPMAEEPGRTFVYNSGVTQLLAQVLKDATGKQPDDYARTELFAPLGIRDFYWKTTPTGLPDAEGGLYLTARDLAKIGYLYLQDGMWEGRRILPEGWARSSVAPAVDASGGGARPYKYGYQWWVLPDPARTGNHAYAALGYGGQRLLVVPEEKLIAVFTGWSIYDRPPLDPFVALERLRSALSGPRR